jgi:hypothetical protein
MTLGCCGPSVVLLDTTRCQHKKPQLKENERKKQKINGGGKGEEQNKWRECENKLII